MLSFTRYAAGRSDRIAMELETLVVAGWAGRDAAAIQHHIEELAAIGVPPPSSVPVFYRGAASLVTQSHRVEVLGPDSSGEIEPVVVSLADGLWVTVGSDHTDRKAETYGIALSKQMCAKPVATVLWKYEEVAPHWDELQLRAHAVIAGERVVYQEGTLAALRPPSDLIAKWTGKDTLLPGTLMFGGTLGAIGGIRPAARFEMELIDPVLKRTIAHAYDIVDLPVVS
ncbi:DUF2848 domain-containing protein [Phreatobacter oligotrophus]|uniref:DUF2848 domain-containing protein n=1 Tax=Phreatobacter oligotrophus TaxID=1122261 RepID=UPI00235689C9|nr:DUF2848 domain-containing protein [Phreatobacter oligotrophus]MBX9990300.1 DUF2848 domain-containing protein [Phreatobacter oligotrophus]